MSAGKIDVTFVTYGDLPESDPDDRLALELLDTYGYSTQTAIWDDAAVDWSNSRLCVIRSTWDYHLKKKEFLAWAKKVSEVSRLFNSYHSIVWNSDKRYLDDIGASGVDIVPTMWINGRASDLRQLLTDQSATSIVIKPVVGLATFGVRKFTVPEELDQAVDHVRSISSSESSSGMVMVQPYLSSIHDYGERALVFFDGEYSHCVRKAPFQELAAAGHAGEERRTATPDEVKLAQSALAVFPEKTLYARVDLLQSDQGNPLVIELELIEPSLFLGMAEDAPRRFAQAISRQLKASASLS